VFNQRSFDEDQVIELLELEEAGLGSARGAVPYGVEEAIFRLHSLGGLAIAAHAKARSGVLKECSGHALSRMLDRASFDAVEISSARDPWTPPRLPRAIGEVPVISGSDAHHVEDRPGSSHPHGVGARPFWAYLPGRRPAFNTLKRALQVEQAVGAVSPLLSWSGRRRVDALLRLDEHWLRVVADDRGSHFDQLVEAVVDLLGADGGHVLVGARRRFQHRATRGADLQRSATDLVDDVARSIFPTPIIRYEEHRGEHGPMVELVILQSENTAGGYTRMPRSIAVSRVRADRAALIRSGAFSTAGIVERLQRLDSGAGISLADLARIFPQRDWFSDDRELRPLLARAIAQLILTLDKPPRWLVQWALDMPRARLELRTAYRELVKRDVARNHRARVREAIADRLADNRAARQTVEQWLEAQQATLSSGRPMFSEPIGSAEDARGRARHAFGTDIDAELQAEGEKASAQYTAAIRGAFGAVAEPVLQVTGNDAVDLRLLADTGIKQVLLAGAAEGDIGAIAVPDPLERAGVKELMAIWAAPEPIRREQAPTLIRRAVESGVHLPVLRFAAALGADGIRGVISDIDRSAIGHKQIRRAVLDDLRHCLEPPEDRHEPQNLSPLTDLDDALDDLRALKLAATAALANPDGARAALLERPTLSSLIQEHAGPEYKTQWRRPCLVLCGLLDDDRLFSWWDEETEHNVRISIVDALSTMQPSPRVDGALHQALESRAGVARSAARALASRGPDGYDILSERMPVDASLRCYVLDGVREVADKNPSRARSLAALACEDAPSPVFAATRKLDSSLHLDEARRACADIGTPAQRPRRRPGRRAPNSLVKAQPVRNVN
jgi:hypothetical protein